MKPGTIELLAVALLMGTPNAGAAIVSGTYRFSATDFFQDESPVDPVVGTFSITFDNSTDISDSSTGTTDGFVLHSINIPAAPAGYSYLAERDLLFIGGLILGPGPIDGSVDDWGLSILDFSSSAPNGFFFAYSPKTDGEFLAPFTFVISVTRITPVDEPGTLALLGLGLLGLDLTRRKRA